MLHVELGPFTLWLGGRRYDIALDAWAKPGFRIAWRRKRKPPLVWRIAGR